MHRDDEHKEYITKFRDSYKEKYGIKLELKEASEMAMRLLNIVRLVNNPNRKEVKK